MVTDSEQRGSSGGGYVKKSQPARFFRHFLTLLGVVLAMAVLATGTASASVSPATKHLISQTITNDARGTAGIAATTCTANLTTPVRAGASEVASDYSVTCDQEVTGIAGFVAIFRGNESAPLGNTVDQFNFGTMGGGEQIKRPCASGLLYAAMRAVVIFKTGEPKMIDRTFFTPAARIAC